MYDVLLGRFQTFPIEKFVCQNNFTLIEILRQKTHSRNLRHAFTIRKCKENNLPFLQIISTIGSFELLLTVIIS
jgi:hypothetical protein